MIYCFNRSVGWASSGVEYAQAYRAKMLRDIGADAKFVFTDMFPGENIQHVTKNIGFLDSEVLWLYTFFTDFEIAPVTYTLRQLQDSFGEKKFTFTRTGKTGKYVFPGTNQYFMVYLVNENSNHVHRVEMVSNGRLIRKDYYTYGRIYSEYYAPLDRKAHLYQRRFFNQDGTVAYEEIIDGEAVMYRFPDRLLCRKEELVGYMVSKLKLTKEDVLLVDRATEIGRAVLQNAGPARVGVVIHADHFVEGSTDEKNILWNNFYEYMFSQYMHVSFYIASTDAQSNLLREQFKRYKGNTPKIVTAPVGSLDSLKIPEKSRKNYSLITASRFAKEKHINWLIEAVAEAKNQVPDVTLDIYGKGAEESNLRKQIEKLNCGSYVKLMGQRKLDEVYQNYEAYVSGSTSEGFGLTLMEAVGSGLPIIGFDVRYGNPTFIDDGENGYLISVNERMEERERIHQLAQCIVRLFTEADLEAFHKHSYEKARNYLTEEVEKKWQRILE